MSSELESNETEATIIDLRQETKVGDLTRTIVAPLTEVSGQLLCKGESKKLKHQTTTEKTERDEDEGCRNPSKRIYVYSYMVMHKLETKQSFDISSNRCRWPFA